MDVHPIPQNVTSFQFKLVGDMTLKQFGYLAGGATIAYLFFVFLAQPYPLIAWPFIIISSLTGAAFAFLPIGSRPLDHWLAAFLKAIYSPTKRAWKKNGKTYKENPLFNSRLVMYLWGVPANATQPSQTTIKPIVTIAQPPSAQSTATPVSAPSSVKQAETIDFPTKEELGKTVDLAKQAQQLQMKIIQTKRVLSQIQTEAAKPKPIQVDYSQQVNQLLSDLQKLISETSQVKQQLQALQAPPSKPQEIPIPPPFLKEKIKIIIPPKPKHTQVALTTFPNVINGIIKDQDNNYLEGVITVIYNKDGLPVRALKTNKLGQFTGSTPLPNGVYTLELEKENFTFDVLQLELTGQVLPPLLITAK